MTGSINFEVGDFIPEVTPTHITTAHTHTGQREDDALVHRVRHFMPCFATPPHCHHLAVLSCLVNFLSFVLENTYLSNETERGSTKREEP